MAKIITFIKRGKNIESFHNIKCLFIDENKKILLSTNNNKDIIFPRSSIKIFQAIPFVNSGAVSRFKLNSKQVAVACSSHSGEQFHINELSNWLKKIHVPLHSLKCGIHNPLNLNFSNKLLLSGSSPNQLHNNCSGKHLAMLTGCILNKYKIKNYLDFKHPYQIKIKKILQLFSETKISVKNFGVDGCSAPQYALSMLDLSKLLLNMVKSYNSKFKYSPEVKLLLNSILKNPYMIGGTNKFDSYLIDIGNTEFFCKGGAEGVMLFAHLTKKIVGVIKVSDGNERALPSALSTILKKLNITNSKQNKKLLLYKNTLIKNHAKKITGSIFTNVIIK